MKATTYGSQLRKVYLESLCVVLKAQSRQCMQKILPANGLPLILQALLRRLRGDEGDELRDALLDAFLSILGDFGGRRNRVLHDSRYIGNLFKTDVKRGRSESRFTSGKLEVNGRWTDRQKPVLFSVFPDFLVGNRCMKFGELMVRMRWLYGISLGWVMVVVGMSSDDRLRAHHTEGESEPMAFKKGEVSRQARVTK